MCEKMYMRVCVLEGVRDCVSGCERVCGDRRC